MSRSGPGARATERAATQTAGDAQLRRPLRSLLGMDVTRQIRSCGLCRQHGRIPVHNKRRAAGRGKRSTYTVTRRSVLMLNHALLELKKGFALRQHGAETLDVRRVWKPQL